MSGMSEVVNHDSLYCALLISIAYATLRELQKRDIIIVLAENGLSSESETNKYNVKLVDMRDVHVHRKEI